MKKIFLLFIMIISVGLFSSFDKIDTGPYIADGQYVISDLSQLQDDQPIYTYDLQRGGPVGLVFCPGTGVACIVNITGPSDDEPVYIVTRKTKGKNNFDIP